MSKARLLAVGGVLTGMAVLFQIVPVVFTEVFVLFTMLSALPIYLIARFSPQHGFAAVAAAGLIISLISVHEGMFFICTNGPVGLLLGVAGYYRVNRWLSALISGVGLTATLSVLNFIIGIPVFGTPLTGPLFLQMGTLLTFSSVYCWLYYFVANFLYNRLIRYWLSQQLKGLLREK